MYFVGARMAKKNSTILGRIVGNLVLKKESILGVDISPHYIRICNLSNEYNRPILKSLASVCIEKMYSFEDIFNNKHLYVDELKSLIQNNNIKVKDVAFSLPSSGSIVTTLTIPDMEDLEFDQAVKSGDIWQSMMNLPAGVSEYSIFYEILEHNKKSTSHLSSSSPNFLNSDQDATMNVMFVAVPKYVISLYTDIISEAGLNPIIADLRCIAVNNALRLNKEMRNLDTVAFIEFGISDNSLLIIDNNKPHLLPITLSDEEKQNLLVNLGNQEFFANFTLNYGNYVQTLIQSFNEQFPNRHINKIYITSTMPMHVNDTSSIPYINLFIDKISNSLSNYSVSECNFCDHISVPNKFTKHVNAEGKLSSWVASLGLASRKFDIFDCIKLPCINKINLLPNYKNIKAEKTFKAISNFVLTSISIIAIACAVTCYLYSFANKLHMQSRITKLKPVEIEYKSKETKLSELKASLNKVNSLNSTKEKLPSNQTILFKTYKHISRAVPDGVWLNSLNFSNHDKIQIDGNSVDDQHILDFISLLQKDGVLKEVSLKNMTTSKKVVPATKAEVIVKQFTLSGIIADVPVQNLLIGK